MTGMPELRAWLDERRAEIEHDHQDSWTGRPDQCYCDLTKPCPDRARELAAVDGLVAVLDERDDLRARLAARAAELERALADVDMRFRLSHGGGWCATCRLPMREGTPVVKTLAVVCEPCAADLAVTAGRLDPTRLAARKSAELAMPDGRES